MTNEILYWIQCPKIPSIFFWKSCIHLLCNPTSLTADVVDEKNWMDVSLPPETNVALPLKFEVDGNLVVKHDQKVNQRNVS